LYDKTGEKYYNLISVLHRCATAGTGGDLVATAPKSNAVLHAYVAAAEAAAEDIAERVPLHLRNAPTKLMTDLGHGKGYRYAHDERRASAMWTVCPTRKWDATNLRTLASSRL
jgi:MgsA AAA+ ATPase C terminal